MLLIDETELFDVLIPLILRKYALDAGISAPANVILVKFGRIHDDIALKSISQTALVFSDRLDVTQATRH